MEKDTQTTDYAAILADMEAKKLALDAAIASLKAAIAAGALGAASDISSVSPSNFSRSLGGEAVPLPRGALLGKSGTEAIKLYLSSVRTKQTNKEIGDALKQGGVESTGKNFDAFVNSSLFRLKNAGELLRFDDGWGLAEWYPESFRTKIAEKSTGSVKRKAKKRTVPRPKATSKSKTETPTEGLQQRIVEAIAFLGGAVSSQGIAESLDVNLGAVNLSLGKMAAKGKVEKGTDGNYRLKVSKPAAMAS